MGLPKMIKEIFTVNEAPPEPMEKPAEEKVNYEKRGYHQAFLQEGSLPGFRIYLQKIYSDFKEKVTDDQEEQEELKKPARIALEEHKGDILRWENKIKKLREEDIPAIKKRMEALKEDKAHIRRNPQEVIGDPANRPSFYIGAIILSFLTVYLFVFYSSASYSAFFKEFTLSNIGVANSIFDGRAVTKALKDGVMELVLILTIPFVFLGFGYLIHRMQQSAGRIKIIKIAALILVTLIFDLILSYGITEKIYEIKRAGNFASLPDFSIPLAAKSVDFWLIIFSGFIVYLIWGFVLEFVLDAFGKLDKVKVALKEKDKQIDGLQQQLDELTVDIDKMTHHIDDTKTRIKKLNETIHSGIITREFEREIYGFIAGWLAWMKGNGSSQEELISRELAAREFINETVYNYPKIEIQ